MVDERWAGMSWERLRAAKALLDLGLYRDSISRSYYAAYCAATSVVVGRGVTFAFGRQNPSHDQLPDLIVNVAGLSVPQRRKVRKILRVLRVARENAEYRPRSLANMETAQDMTKERVAAIVRERLKSVSVAGITMEVVGEDIYKIDAWWRVPIRPSRWPKRMFEFYEVLAEVEDELQEQEHLNILMATGEPLEEEEDALTTA